MSEITDFGLVVLVVSAVFALAVFSNKLSERIPVPAPALFLLSAALAVHFIPRLGREISIKDVERVAVRRAGRDPLRRRYACRLEAVPAGDRADLACWAC